MKYFCLFLLRTEFLLVTRYFLLVMNDWNTHWLRKGFWYGKPQILCHKLNYYGFGDKINDLISSYLSGRNQFASINGFDSKLLPISCVVPQGSPLGPLLFLLYMNYMKYATASHFSDDTCLTYANSKLKILESNFNFGLKNREEWLRISLNV